MKRDRADALFSDWIRERDGWTCQRCWKTYPPRTGALHAAHMFGRWKQSVRFDPEDACALDVDCHRHLDTHPDEKRDFFRRRLGDRAFALLEIRSNTPAKKLSLSDVVALLARSA